MSCKLNSCTVHEYILDPLPDPAAAPGTPSDPKKAVTVTKDDESSSIIITSGEHNAVNSLIDRLAQDMREAQEAECGGAQCICIRREGAAGESSTFNVPVEAYYQDGNGKTKHAEGSIRITVTDYPGKCFTNYFVKGAHKGTGKSTEKETKKPKKKKTKKR
jgi:hypothetical protein